MRDGTGEASLLLRDPRSCRLPRATGVSLRAGLSYASPRSLSRPRPRDPSLSLFGCRRRRPSPSGFALASLGRRRLRRGLRERERDRLLPLEALRLSPRFAAVRSASNASFDNGPPRSGANAAMKGGAAATTGGGMRGMGRGGIQGFPVADEVFVAGNFFAGAGAGPGGVLGFFAAMSGWANA